MRIKNKKGNLQDAIFIIVTLFAFALVGIIGLIIVNSIQDANITSGSLGNTSIVNNTLANGLAFFESLDVIFVWVIVLLGITMMISAYFINTHPVFLFGGGIIFILIGIILASGFAEAFLTLTDSPAFDNVRGDFVVRTWAFSNLPVILLFLFVMAIIALWAKGVFQGGGA